MGREGAKMNDSKELAPVVHAGIAKNNEVISIGELEHRLLARYPREDAEPWDRMGLVVGDASRSVAGVAVALDVTQEAIALCVELGANVLLTHHPVFIEPPAAIGPQRSRTNSAGAAVWAAATKGIALMNFHTALDANPDGNRVLPRMLSLTPHEVVCPIGDDPVKGYGCLCTPDGSMTLTQLGARCLSVFGRRPRVWGDRDDRIDRIVVATGSAGNVVDACITADADCLICGEIHYHDALDALQAGLHIIELGHDVSELPLAAVLGAAAVECGVPAESVYAIDQSGNWDTPVATRL